MQAKHCATSLQEIIKLLNKIEAEITPGIRLLTVSQDIEAQKSVRRRIIKLLKPLTKLAQEFQQQKEGLEQYRFLIHEALEQHKETHLERSAHNDFSTTQTVLQDVINELQSDYFSPQNILSALTALNTITHNTRATLINIYRVLPKEQDTGFIDRNGNHYHVYIARNREYFDASIQPNKGYEKHRYQEHIKKIIHALKEYLQGNHSVPEGEIILPRKSNTIKRYAGHLNASKVKKTRVVFYCKRQGDVIEVHLCEYVTEHMHNDALSHSRNLGIRYNAIYQGKITRHDYDSIHNPWVDRIAA